MAEKKGFANEFVQRYFEYVVEAFVTFWGSVTEAFVVGEEPWSLLFIGLVFGQGPIQLWEARMLDALDRLRNDLTDSAALSFIETSAARTVAIMARKHDYTTRVVTVEKAITMALDWIVDSVRRDQLFDPSGLSHFVQVLEHRIGSPLRKLLKFIHTGELFNFTKFVFKIVASTVGIIMVFGGLLALVFLAARIADDVENNPGAVDRFALTQTNKRRTVVDKHRTREK